MALLAVDLAVRMIDGVSYKRKEPIVGHPALVIWVLAPPHT